MRAVRIRQLAGDVDLVRLELLEEPNDVRDVFRMNRLLFDRAGAIKAQVHEDELLRRHARGQRSGSRFGLTD